MRHLWVLQALSALLLVPACAPVPSKHEHALYPPGSPIAGRTCAKIAAEWWAWELSIPDGQTHPVRGGDCRQGLQGDVLFLATNTRGEETRECEVPARVPIVTSILSRTSYACPEAGYGPDDCINGDPSKLPSFAASSFDGLELELSVELDGQAVAGDLKEYFCPGEVFAIAPPTGGLSILAEGAIECAGPMAAGNVCGFPAGPRHSTASGFFVGVEPLEPGTHTLRFRGCIPSQKYCQDKTFILTAAE